MKDFAKVVKRRIKARGTKMPEVAKLAGVSREYLYRVLSESQSPSLEVAENILAAVDLKLQIVDPAAA